MYRLETDNGFSLESFHYLHLFFYNLMVGSYIFVFLAKGSWGVFLLTGDLYKIRARATLIVANFHNNLGLTIFDTSW